MITKIKLFKVVIKHIIFDKKQYFLQDISDQLEMPIYNTDQLDDVLDTTRISLLNKIKKPLKPFTRIIIELTDTIDGQDNVSKIYRYVENDSVTNIVRGNEPVYMHSVNLIEITKILERRIVDNHCFTNFLPYNYGVAKTKMGFIQDEASCSIYSKAVGTDINQYTARRFTYHEYGEYSDRFMGPNILLDNETGTFTIPTNVFIDVKGAMVMTSTSDNPFYTLMVINWGWFGGGEIEVTVPLTEYYVSKPNGTRTNITTSSGYTFNQAGHYTITQVYSYKVDNHTIFYYKVHWDYYVYEDESHVAHEYTIKEVVERVLNTCSVLAVGIDEPEFKLNPALEQYLSTIESPEFSLTQCTLYEALSQIGKYIHAIPRLIPNVFTDITTDEDDNVVSFENDFKEWNIITFDFLGNKDVKFVFQNTTAFIENNRFTGNNYSLIDLENPSDEFATDLVSNIQNATVTNYEGGYTVTEPYKDGFISTRTESTSFEISDNECIIKTRLPIRTIIKVQLRVEGDNNKIVDITSRVIEKKVYDLKKDYNASDYSVSKSHFLYYEEGKNNILGCDYVRPNRSSYDTFANTQSIKAILQWGGITGWNGRMCDIEVQVKYIPFLGFKARQFKTFYDKNSEKSTLLFNQQANEIDVNHYGENMNSTLLKTGNIKVSRTQYFTDFADVPRCGQWHVTDYFAFQVNTEISCNMPIKSTSAWSKHYNELFADVAIKKDVRQFEISEKECIARDIDIQEFCVVDTKLDVQEVYNDQRLTDMQEWVEKQLAPVGFGTNDTMSAIAAKLHNDSGSYSGITGMICSTETTNKDGVIQYHHFFIPVACFPFGRSIVVQFAFDDNYSAATYSEDAPSQASYAFEKYIEYGNEYGQFNNISFILADKISGVLANNANRWTSYEDACAAGYSNIAGASASERSRVKNWTNPYTGNKYRNYQEYLDAMFQTYMGYAPTITTVLTSGLELSKQLYKLNAQDIAVENEYGRFLGGSEGDHYLGYHIDKDSREKIAGTVQLNFITPNPKIEIYKSFIESLPIVGDRSTTYKYVVFAEKQSKFNDYVIGDYYEQPTPNIQWSNKTKHIRISHSTASSTTSSGGGTVPFVAQQSINMTLSSGEGYGIITSDGKLCVYIETKIQRNSVLPPIYLMFRRKI